MRFKDLRLGKKLAILLGIILFVMGGVNAFTLVKMTSLKDDINRITSRWLPSAVAVANINAYTSDLRIAQLQHAFAREDSVKQELQFKMIDLIERIEQNQDRYESLLASPEERRLYDRFGGLWEQYIELSYQFHALSRDNKYEEAVALLNQRGQVLFNEFSEVLEELVRVNEQASFDAAFRAESVYQRTRRLTRTLLAATVLIALVFATVIVRLVTSPVRKLAGAAESVAAGNMDVTLEVEGKDEIGRLSASFNQMTASLRKARADVVANQRQLEKANDELEDKNKDLEDALNQLKEAQQQLVLREKMASLGHLVAGVAHEINNPVGAVKSAADTSARSIELVTSTLAGAPTPLEIRDNEKFHKALEIIKSNNEIALTASDRIAGIVRSLKNFARLDESEFQEANVHEGLDSTLTLLHHEMKNRIEVERNYGVLPRIQCYPNQLNQVFMNLLANAAQAIQGKGVITVATARRDDKVEISISDTGKGIPPNEIERLFDPGFTTKGTGVGTGLGLSISYNIIEKHRGSIRVSSEVGKGTTMRVTLPVKQLGREAGAQRPV